MFGIKPGLINSRSSGISALTLPNVLLNTRGDTMTDISGYNRPVTIHCSPVIDTSVASMNPSIKLNGNGDYLSVPGFNFMSGDFCVEDTFFATSYAQLENGTYYTGIFNNFYGTTGAQLMLYG
jgi:hypothetical protein